MRSSGASAAVWSGVLMETSVAMYPPGSGIVGRTSISSKLEGTRARMLSKEENEFLTRVGPGTPAGTLLRRYWHPVAVAQELSPEQPTRFVRLLGEDLVLFRDRQGRIGLLADHCAHRGASLCYGRVEERGISCAYHGWLFD